MDKTRALLPILLAALIAAVAGLAWILSRAGGAGSGGPGVEPIGSTALRDEAATAAPEDEPAAAGRSERTSAPIRSEAEARLESFEIEGALWIEGSVVLPPGAPVDDRLEVFAAVLRPGSGHGDALARRGRDRVVEMIEEAEPGEAAARRPVDGSARFEIPFPADAREGLLLLRGRWLFLDEPLVVDLAGGVREVVLRPRLGALLTGRLVPPPGADPEAVRAELRGLRIELMGARVGTATGMLDRATEAGETLEFEVGGLNPDMLWNLAADPREYPLVLVPGIQLHPGRRCDQPLELARGVRLSGRVVDEAGRPVAGARVRARSSHWNIRRLAGPRVQETAGAGAFELVGVRAGEITVTASAPDYREVEEALGELQPGELREGIEVVLARGDLVAGRVVWPDGAPAVGARVRLAAGTGSPRSATVQTLGLGREVKPDGGFLLGGLDPGPYALRASCEPRAEDEDTSPLFKAYVEGVQAGTRDLVLELRPTSSVAGLAVDDAGAPVPAFRVSARQQGVALGEGLAGRFEDQGGAFELAGFAEGRWTLEARAEGFSGSEPLEVAVPHRGPPAVLRLIRGARLAGVVLDPGGAPVAGASVRARCSLEGGAVASHDGDADEQGRFELRDLAAGSFALTASSESWAPSQERTLTLAAGEAVEDLVLSLTAGGTLEGRVFGDDGAPATGRTIMTVPLVSPGGDQVQTISDGDGRFRVERLAPGRWQAMALPDMQTMAGMASGAEDIDPVTMFSRVKSATVEIAEGETTHVVLGEPPAAPVRVHGRVTRGGEPLAGAILAAVGEGRAILEALDMQRTDEDGRYEIEVDAPGHYTVLVGQEDLGEEDATTEFLVTIPEVDEHRLDLALPIGVIEGRVLGPGGDPLAGARVSWKREGSLGALSITSGAHATSTDERGAWRFAGLRPGTYAVRASAPWQEGGDELGRDLADGLRLAEDEVLRGIDLRLPRAGRAIGRVVDVHGEPVAGATVFARDAAGRPVDLSPRVESDSGGRFEYRGLSPGSVTLSARTCEGLAASREVGPVEVLEGGTCEVEIELEPGTLLRIDLEGEDREPLRCSVSVLDSEGSEVSCLLPRDHNEALLSEGISSTEHRVGPLPSGRYRVIATAPDGREATRSVTLRGQEERRVRLRLRD